MFTNDTNKPLKFKISEMPLTRSVFSVYLIVGNASIVERRRMPAKFLLFTYIPAILPKKSLMIMLHHSIKKALHLSSSYVSTHLYDNEEASTFSAKAFCRQLSPLVSFDFHVFHWRLDRRERHHDSGRAWVIDWFSRRESQSRDFYDS